MCVIFCCTVLLAGWEFLAGMTILSSGAQLLMSANNTTDLMLNAVALHFLYIVGDFVTQLVPDLGLICEIDVPKIVVLPRYVSDPQWREATFYYWYTKAVQYASLNTPFLGIIVAVTCWLSVQYAASLGNELMASNYIAHWFLILGLLRIGYKPCKTSGKENYKNDTQFNKNNAFHSENVF